MVPRIYSQNNAVRFSALLLFLFASITSFGQNPPSFAIPGSSCPAAAAVTIPMGADTLFFTDANIEALLGTTAIDPDGDPVTYTAVITGTMDNFVTCADIAGGPVMVTVTASDDEMPPMTADCGPITVTVSSGGGLPNAVCMAFTAEIDAAGMITVLPSDIDGGSSSCSGIISYMVDDDGAGPNLPMADKTYMCADTGAQTLTLVITDAFGTSTCDATVTVVDNTAPTFTCPLDQVVILEPTAPCTMTIPDLSTFAALAPMDNCSSIEADYTITQTPAALSTTSSSDGGTVDVLISVKDKSGNETTCTVTLTGDDTTNPNAVAPGTALNVVLDGTGNYSLDGADSLFLINGNIDNCGTVNATISDVMFDCADIAGNPNMISVTLDDGNGNTAAAYMASVVVMDNVPADTIANMEANNATGQCSQTVIIPGSTTDNCTSGTVSNVMATDFKGNPITITVSGSDFDGEFPVGVSTVTYDLTDGTNMTSESFTVTIFDDEAPNVLYPSGVILNYANCTNPVVLPNYGFLANINDNCTGYNITQDPAPGTLVSDITTLASGQTFMVEILVEDNFPSATNLGDSMTFVVTLNEDNTPVPNTPGAVLPALFGECGPLVVDAPYAVDECGNTICGVPFPLPAGTVNLGPACGTGGGGACITASRDIPTTGILPDNNSAGVNIPIEFTESGIVEEIEIALNVEHTWVGDLILTLTDPDGNSIVVFDRPGTPPGTFGCPGNDLAVTFTNSGAPYSSFESTCGNSPAIMGPFQPMNPFSVIIDNNVDAQGIWILNISDNAAGDTGGVIAGGSLSLCIQDNSSTATPDYLFPVGTHNITWNYDAGNGNIVTQQQMITVTEDIEGPDVACQDITIELDADGDASIVADDLVQADGFSMVISEDGTSGISGQAEFSVTVPATTTLMFDYDYTNIDPTFEALFYSINGVQTEITDASGTGTTSVNVNAGEVFSIGLLTDDNLFGETSFVTISNFSLGFSGAYSLGNWVFSSSNVPFADFDINDGEVTDNCSDPGDIILSLSQTSFNCNDIGDNTVTLFATDEAGNPSQCTATVTVVDEIAPILNNIPANVGPIAPCGAIIPSPPTIGSGINDINATDACGTTAIVFNETSTQVPDPSVCGFYDYQITRTWTVSDVNGNMTEATQTITIEDIVAPFFTANFPMEVTANASAGDCSAFVNLAATAAGGHVFDCAAFENLTIVNDGNGADNESASGIYPVGTTTVIFQATDPCGNVSAIRPVTIIVTDNTAPIASCKNNIAIAIPSGQDSIIINPALIDNGSVDNCPGPITLSVSPSVFYCSQIADGTEEEFEITLFVEANGQISSCQTTIIIQDNSAPIVSCVDPLIITLDANGTATATTAMLNNGIEDCSDIALIELTGNTTFDVDDIGGPYGILDGLTPTLQVTDIHGNVGTCTPAELYVTPPTTCLALDNVTSNGQVEIPMTSTSFVNVIGFQFSMQIDDPTVATFAMDDAANLCGGITINVPNISGIHQELICNGSFTNIISVTGDTLSISWFNTSPNPVTIPDGETLFNARIEALGVVGDMTTFSVTGAPYGNELTTKYGNDILTDNPPLCFDPNPILPTIGTFTVGDNATLPISGNVSTWTKTRIDTIGFDTTSMMPLVIVPIYDTVYLSGGQGLANATITKIEELVLSPFTIDTTSTDMTDGNGDYTVQVQNVTGGVDVFLSPSKNNPNWLNNGDVSSSDLFFIQQHIVNNIPFVSIYEYIAADVNQSGTITTLDLVLIQDVIVNPELAPIPSSVIDAYNPWRFIQREYAERELNPFDLDPSIPLPSQPMAPIVPVNEQDSTMNSVMSPLSEVDWIAVKIGQVFGGLNTNTLTTNDVDSRTGENLVMSVENQKVTDGELISIPVYAKDYAAFIAWQFTLEFDENYLAYEGMIPGAITGFEENKLGLNSVEEGIIGAVWYGSPNTVKSDEVLFTLQFTALENADALSGLIEVTSRTVKSESSLLNGATGEVSLTFFAPATVTTTDFKLHQNRPNPFNGETLISFNLPEAGFAKVTISDISGRTLKVIEGDFAKGYNEVTIQSNELSSTGVLYYQLESAEHIATKKMIILE